MSSRSRWVFAPLILVLALNLSACSDGGDPPSPAPTTGSTDSTDATGAVEIAVTRQDEMFTPNGERVEAKMGEPVTITITSDVAGEFHVHSVPEQEIAYKAGTSEHVITIDQPGVVEVESHDPASIVLQLEVR